MKLAKDEEFGLAKDESEEVKDLENLQERWR